MGLTTGTCRPSNTHGAPDYKYPQNISSVLRINEGHKLAGFCSATTAVSRSCFCGPLLLCVLHEPNQTQFKQPLILKTLATGTARA